MDSQYQPNFQMIAAKMAQMGAYVIPCDPPGNGRTGKQCTLPAWQDKATRDINQIGDWSRQNPHFNCAIVGKPEIGALWGFDDDGGVLAEYEQQYGPIKTYRVRTVSGNTQLLFKHNEASIALDNLTAKDEQGRELFSARTNNRYVVSAGSVAFPNNDEAQPITAYTAVDLSEPIEAPESFIAFLRSKAGRPATVATPIVATSAASEGMVHEGGRNTYLHKVGSKLRHAGATLPEIEAVLMRVNSEHCVPPLAEREVRTIAGSASKYKEDGVVLIGGVPAGQSPLAAPLPTHWRDSFKAVGELEQGDVRMLIDGFLPEGTVFIGGLPGEGKTLFALSICRALTTGKKFLNTLDVPQIVPVIYLIPESGGRAFRKRCETFEIPDDPNLFLCRTVSEGSTLPLDSESLFEAIRTLKPVVILDTVIRFSEAQDENQAMQNKALVDDVIRLRQAGAVAVIGLHHSTKAMREKGMSLETALRGTGDIAASADAVYGMLRDNALYNNGSGPNEIDVVCLKPRDFDPPQPFRIAATQKPVNQGITIGMASIIDRTHDFKMITRSTQSQDLSARLEEVIQATPTLTVTNLVEMTGKTEWVIRQTLNRLGYTRKPGGGSTRWVKGEVNMKPNSPKVVRPIKTERGAIEEEADVDFDLPQPAA